MWRERGQGRHCDFCRIQGNRATRRRIGKKDSRAVPSYEDADRRPKLSGGDEPADRIECHLRGRDGQARQCRLYQPIGWADLIYYLADDPHTQSIVMYMETIGDARAFLSAAREVALTKPIIVIKPGRTEGAARAAAS